MAGDKMTAQIGSKNKPFRLFDTEQANFGVYGYCISAWVDADGRIYYPGQVINYSDIQRSDEDVVHLSARWCKKQYDTFAVKVPNECSSELSGFERSNNYG